MNGIYQCPLFASLNSEEVDGLLHLRSKTIQFNAGDLIAVQSEAYKTLLCVDQGIVRGEMTHSNGERIVIEEIAAPRIIAPAFFFASNNRLPVDIIAKTHVQLVAISKTAFTEILQTDSRVLHNFLRQISDRSQFLSDRLRMMRFGTIQSKLAHYLWEQRQEEEADAFKLKHTQQELADLFGVTRPALARSMRTMADSGLIAIQNKKVEILNPKGIQQLL